MRAAYTSRIRHHRITIARPGLRRLRLAVVADTHSSPHPATHGLLQAWAPDAVLHAGDIGDLAVLDGLASIAPVHAVRGNIDVHAATLPDVLTIDVGGDLRILLIHIGLAGVRLRSDVAKVARAERASLVICGHSHIPFIGEERHLLVFNPGSVGPRRFHLPIVFGTLALPAGASCAQLGHIDATTGLAWSPPPATG
jgi:uncharacterized protein